MIPLMLDLSAKRILIFGAGAVGVRKARHFSGCRMTVVSRSLSPDVFSLPQLSIKQMDVADLEDDNLVKLIEKHDFVIAALSDAGQNDRIIRLAKSAGKWYNCATSDDANFLIPSTVSGDEYTIAVSTVGWSLPPIYGPVTDPNTKLTGFDLLTPANSDNYLRNNVRWHIGLCEAMNIGLANWEDSRMAMHILDLYTSNKDPSLNASTDQQEALLRSAMVTCIANTDVIFRLAKARKGNATRILDLMEGFGNFFVSVSDGATGATALARNTNFGDTQAGADLTALLRNQFSTNASPRNQKKITNEWALFVRNAIFIGAFTNIPDANDPRYNDDRLAWFKDKNAYSKAVAEELKYQKKLGNSPFLAEVQALNDKYDKVRLDAQRDRTRSVKEERQRRQAEENVW